MTKTEYIERMETLQSQIRREKQDYSQRKEVIHRDHRHIRELEEHRFHNALIIAQNEYTEKLESLIDQQKHLRIQWAEQEAEEKRRETEAA